MLSTKLGETRHRSHRARQESPYKSLECCRAIVPIHRRRRPLIGQ